MQHIYQIMQQAKVELENEQLLYALVFSQVPYIPLLSAFSNEKAHLHRLAIMELSREIPLGLSIAALWIHNQHWWEKSSHPQNEAEIHMLQKRFYIEKKQWKWAIQSPQFFFQQTSTIIDEFQSDEKTEFCSDKYQVLPHLEYPAIILKETSLEFDALFFTPRNICLYSWGKNQPAEKTTSTSSSIRNLRLI